MRTYSWTQIFYACSLLGLLYFLAACGATHSSSQDLPSVDDDSAMLKLIAQFESGKTHYLGKCASCHNAVGSSTKRNRISSEIIASIESVSQMRQLTSLTEMTKEEVYEVELALSDSVKELIEDYLKSKQPPLDPKEDPENKVTFVKPTVGTRTYVASVYERLFVAPEGERNSLDQEILNTISNLIHKQAGAFGGPCRRYDENCTGSAAVNRTASVLPVPSALRKGYSNRACEEVLQKDRAVSNALGRAGVDSDESASELLVGKVFDTFYPGRPMDEKVLTELMNLFKAGSDQGFANMDSWRFVLLSMCKSSHLEVL